MTARDSILAKIRRSLGTTGDDIGRRAAVSDRLIRAPRGLVPERGQLDGEARIALFSTMAEKANATVERVADLANVPSAVAAYLRAKNLPARVRRGTDERLAALPWAREPAVDVSVGRSHGEDLVGLSAAFAGVAETGTVVLVSGEDNPTTLNLLPEHHLVVVPAEAIAGDYETVWDALRAVYGKGAMPRTVNWITGPSRSGDIEQKLLLGAHGPRSVHLIVVG